MAKWQTEGLKLARETGMPVVQALAECYDADEDGFDTDDIDDVKGEINWRQEMFDLYIENYKVRTDHTGEGVYVYLDDYKLPAHVRGKQWAEDAVDIFIMRGWLV